MWNISSYSNEKIEKKIEKYIKESYSKWEYLRCYNLLNLLLKVNPNNKILLKYANKFNDKFIKKQRIRWWRWFLLKDILKSPKLYIFLLILYLTWSTK